MGEDAEEELVVDDDHGSANKVGVAGGGFLECLGEFAACDEPFGPGGEFLRVFATMRNATRSGALLSAAIEAGVEVEFVADPALAADDFLRRCAFDDVASIIGCYGLGPSPWLLGERRRAAKSAMRGSEAQRQSSGSASHWASSTRPVGSDARRSTATNVGLSSSRLTASARRSNRPSRVEGEGVADVAGSVARRQGIARALPLSSGGRLPS